MKKYKSKALCALHESMRDLHKAGGISEERMREYDKACLVNHAAPVPHTVTQKSVGTSEHSSAPVYARGK
jgi:putative transcriptional regulator